MTGQDTTASFVVTSTSTSTHATTIVSVVDVRITTFTAFGDIISAYYTGSSYLISIIGETPIPTGNAPIGTTTTTFVGNGVTVTQTILEVPAASTTGSTTTVVTYVNPPGFSKRDAVTPTRSADEYSLKRNPARTLRKAIPSKATPMHKIPASHLKKRQVYCEPSPTITPSSSPSSTTSSTSSFSTSSCALCLECVNDPGIQTIPPTPDDADSDTMDIVQDDTQTDLYSPFEKRAAGANTQKPVNICLKKWLYKSGLYAQANGPKRNMFPAFGFNFSFCTSWDIDFFEIPAMGTYMNTQSRSYQSESRLLQLIESS